MSRATEDTLALLHNAVAEALLKKLQDGESVSAADIQAAAKFLKDNNITATPGASKALDALQHELESSATSAIGSPASQADLDEALRSIEAMGGVN